MMIDGCRNGLLKQRAIRDKRIKLGVCVICQEPNPRKSQKCKSCTDKTVAANKLRREVLVKNCQCIKCGNDWSGETLICPPCRLKINQKWRGKDALSSCFRCSMPRDTHHKACSECRHEMRINSQQRRKANQTKGLCVQCRSENDTECGKYCSVCSFKTSARRWLNDSNKWTELRDLLIFQDGKCAYTDVKLSIGGNASIDHKMPRSKGGAASIENLQWIDWKINRMKTDIPHDEFVSICDYISKKKRHKEAS